MKVKLLLKEDIDNLGKTGDLVEVRAGYARNFLIPRDLAAEVNKSSLIEIEALKKRKAAREVALKEDLSKLAASIKATPVKMEMRVTESGVLYGSIQAGDIAKALAAKGMHVEAKQVKLEAPIKAVGSYVVPIQLHAEIAADCQVAVAASGEAPAAMTLEEEEAARAKAEDGEDGDGSSEESEG